MPDGYYHLPPDKQLGLPVGEWTFAELQVFLESLPYGVVIQYFYDPSVAYVKYEATGYYHEEIKPFDSNQIRDVYDSSTKIIYIVKQPSPNLYNPLDPKEEVLMEDNSANEKQPAKETAPVELPWQDISTLPSDYEGDVWVYNETIKDSFHYMKAKHTSWQELAHDCLSHKLYWLPLTPPKAPMVEVPVEPERVSVQEFAKNPVGKWVNLTYDCALDFWNEVKSDKYTYHLAITAIGAGHPIYATNPTAWLAWLAEQEGKI
jgi:hypothetical protein